MKTPKPHEVIEARAKDYQIEMPNIGATSFRKIADIHWIVSTLHYLNKLHELNPNLNWPNADWPEVE